MATSCLETFVICRMVGLAASINREHRILVVHWQLNSIVLVECDTRAAL